MNIENFRKHIDDADNDAIVEIQSNDTSCHSTISATKINTNFHRRINKSDEPMVNVSSIYFYEGEQLTVEDLKNALDIFLIPEYNDREIVIDGKYPITDVYYNGQGILTIYIK